VVHLQNIVNDLAAQGLTDVRVLIINMPGADKPDQLDQMTKLTNLPVLQDDTTANVWLTYKATKDAMWILGRSGAIQAFHPLLDLGKDAATLKADLLAAAAP
jgi:hypothetical protein